MVWSDPLSLATTHGVSLPAGTEMFHFPAYPRNNKVPCRPMTAGGLPHSEILGSKPCWRLPEAYRILKRPSSVLSAKASTIRPSGSPVSTGRLHPSRGFHLRPIEHVFNMRATGTEVPRNPNLGAGFPLRCFQRLSLPNVANRPCRWRDNRHTRGPSTQVLSYYGQASSGFQRAQRIETKLSHDVLNPARVPL